MRKEELEIKIIGKKVYQKVSEMSTDSINNQVATSDELVGYEFIHTTKASVSDLRESEAGVISINELSYHIDEAKKANANFIALDYHYDHGQYEIYGYNISRATETQVAKDSQRNIEAIELSIVEKLTPEELAYINSKTIK